MTMERVKSSATTKTAKITALLERYKGASVAEIAKGVNWQHQSVRGFLSGTLKKKLKLQITSTRDGAKPRRYFIARVAK